MAASWSTSIVLVSLDVRVLNCRRADRFLGRTGRIGNQGLATSFFNDRDADLAETLVKTLLETKQHVPDFLEEHLPEGFTADGQGDVNTLKFEADSDDEDETGDASDAVGNSGWGASTETPAVEGNSGWGASTETPATGGGWGSTDSPAVEPSSAPSAPGGKLTLPV